MITIDQTPHFEHYTAPSQLPRTLVAFPTKSGYELVKEDTIVYCQAEGNYTRIFFTSDQPLLISRKVKATYEKLGNPWIIRIHQSYLVNMHFAKKYIRKSGGQLVLNTGETLPISRSYKEGVLDFFKFV